MTAEAQLPAITCPSSLIASCAPLLGFEPRACLVVLIFDVPGHPGPVLVRVDVGPVAEGSGPRRSLAQSIKRTGGRRAALVCFVEATATTRRAELPATATLEKLAAELRHGGILVEASVTTNGHVVWDHGCTEPGCCEAPRPLEASVVTRIRAEYAFAGYAPLANRGAVADRVAPDPLGATAVAGALRPLRVPRDMEGWRDREIAFVDSWLLRASGGQGSGRAEGASDARDDPWWLAPAQCARGLTALADIRVRDTVLLRIIHTGMGDTTGRARQLEAMCAVLRVAPDGYVAPLASLLALCAWMAGDGALANVALDRADLDDPSYRLAALARQAIVAGVDPRSWRAAMSGLTEAECRGGGAQG